MYVLAGIDLDGVFVKHHVHVEISIAVAVVCGDDDDGVEHHVWTVLLGQDFDDGGFDLLGDRCFYGGHVVGLRCTGGRQPKRWSVVDRQIEHIR